MSKLKSRARAMSIALLLLIGAALTLPAIPYVWLSITSESALATDSGRQNPQANFWRGVRRGQGGYTAVPGREAGVLIHGNGVNWQKFRSRILAPYGSFLMGLALVVIAVFFVVRGPIRLEAGDSGTLISRFTVYQRTIHWFTAILFWLLALTGLVLLYGRYILIPMLGAKGFAITAAAGKEAHNLFGPLFLLALILLFVEFVRDNLYQKGDLRWLKDGGGMFGSHASAGRFNPGEKIWFWLVCLLGLAVSLSGLVLDFSILGLDRTAMELAHVVHTAAAVLFISISFGHIYLGTIGTQGTLQGMTSGTVDANWIRHHHDRWKTEAELVQSDAGADRGNSASAHHD